MVWSSAGCGLQSLRRHSHVPPFGRLGSNSRNGEDLLFTASGVRCGRLQDSKHAAKRARQCVVLLTTRRGTVDVGRARGVKRSLGSAAVVVLACLSQYAAREKVNKR